MEKQKDYVSCIIKGGIGNQLFMIANVIEYAKKYDKIPVFLNLGEQKLNNEYGYIRKTEWDGLFKKGLNYIDINKYNEMNFIVINEIKNTLYCEMPYFEGNVLFNGYFHSKYYIGKNTKKIIKNLIYSNTEYVYKSYYLYDKIKKFYNNDNDDKYVSMHVRKCDYEKYNKYFINLDIDYYKKCYQDLKDTSINIIVFSDDIEWCKKNFKINNKECYIDINDPAIELILMSMFKNIIIANSSFSWWAAFINDDKYNKKIYCPSKWFGEEGPKYWEDYYFEHWKIV